MVAVVSFCINAVVSSLNGIIAQIDFACTYFITLDTDFVKYPRLGLVPVRIIVNMFTSRLVSSLLLDPKPNCGDSVARKAVPKE